MIDTRIFFLLYRNDAEFTFFSRFKSIFSMTVWNTIDDDTPFFHYIETEPHFLLLSLFQSIFSMTVWILSMIDTPIFFSSIYKRCIIY